MEQVGGDHYKSDYQHWDWAVDVGLGPLEYGATRYICRHWKKDGIEDLKKAKHFVIKLRELQKSGNYEHYKRVSRSQRSLSYIEDMRRFAKLNKLPYLEAHICHLLIHWKDRDDLFNVTTCIDLLIKTSEMAAGAPAPAQATTPTKQAEEDVPAPVASGMNTGNTIILKQPRTTCPICGLEETEHHVCGEPSE